MSASNWFSTTNSYIKYRVEVTVNSQDQVSNYSNITVKVYCHRTNSGYETYGNGTCYCVIDGTEYSQSITTSQTITDSGVYLFSKTLNVAHDSDGSKSVTISAWIDHSRFTSSSNSYTLALTTLPRASAIQADNGTLGSALSISIIKADSSFTHTIQYSCGSASGTIVTQTSGTSVSWTPPSSLAAQNTSGSTVSVTLTCISYSGGTQLGSSSITISLTIPNTGELSCSISVSDISGYQSQYGYYVQAKSKLRITINPVLQQGSPIVSFSTTVNGTTYAQQTFDTDALRSSGTVTITTTIRDGRGATATATVSIYVLAYAAPAIHSLTATRCNSNGTDNFEGEYVRIDFEATISSLSNKNSATYRLAYKQTGASSYTTVTLSSYTNNYAPSGSYVVAMSSAKTYDVVLYAIDNFGQATNQTTAGAGFVLIGWGSDGRSMAFGKPADHADTVEFGIEALFSAGIRPVEISSGQNFNYLLNTGFYHCDNSGSYTNSPFASNSYVTEFFLEVKYMPNTGYLFQTAEACYTSGGSLYFISLSRMRSLGTSGSGYSWSAWNQRYAYRGHTHTASQVSGVASESHTHTTADIANLVDYLYPVGAIYMSVNNVSPALLFGGTWEPIQDRFLLAAGTSHSGGETGGEESYDLSVSHSHVSPIGYSSSIFGLVRLNGTESDGSGDLYRSITATNTGSSLGSNINMAKTKAATVSANIPTMPPYLTVYMWQRTA